MFKLVSIFGALSATYAEAQLLAKLKHYCVGLGEVYGTPGPYIQSDVNFAIKAADMMSISLVDEEDNKNIKANPFSLDQRIFRNNDPDSDLSGYQTLN